MAAQAKTNKPAKKNSTGTSQAPAQTASKVDQAPTPTTPSKVAQSPTATTAPVLDTVAGVAEYLTAPGIDIDTKLDVLSKNSLTTVRSLVASLLEFSKDFGPNHPEQEPEYVTGRLFTLYNTIKGVAETVDASEFTVKMDIVNLVFIRNSAIGQAFHSTMLLRYDYLWSWGDASLKTHQILCTVISALADRTTRELAIKRININNSFARTGLTITQPTVERLIRYYS